MDKPWKRGPYHKSGNKEPSAAHVPAAPAGAQVKKAAAAANVTALKAAHAETVKKLEENVAQLNREVAQLKAEIKAKADRTHMDIHNAVLQAQLSASNKMFAKFSEGVAMGMGRAAGSSAPVPIAPTFTPYHGSIPRMSEL